VITLSRKQKFGLLYLVDNTCLLCYGLESGVFEKMLAPKLQITYYAFTDDFPIFNQFCYTPNSLLLVVKQKKQMTVDF